MSLAAKAVELVNIINDIVRDDGPWKDKKKAILDAANLD